MTVAQPTSVEPVTRENWRSTLPLEVAPDKQRFVAHYSPISLVVLAKAHVGALGKHWVPLLFDATANRPAWSPLHMTKAIRRQTVGFFTSSSIIGTREPAPGRLLYFPCFTIFGRRARLADAWYSRCILETCPPSACTGSTGSAPRETSWMASLSTR